MNNKSIKLHLGIKTLSLCLLLLLFPACHQSQELSDIQNISQLKAFDEKYNLYEIEEEHTLTWHSIPIKNANIFGGTLTFDIKVDSSTEFATQKAVDYLVNTFGKQVMTSQDYFEKLYTVHTPKYTIKLSTDVADNKVIEKNTSANVDIIYYPQFEEALPNLAKKRPKNPEGKLYFLEINSFNCSYEVHINGIYAYNLSGRDRFMEEELFSLNPFILDNSTCTINLIVTPGYNEDGEQRETIIKDSYINAVLTEQNANLDSVENSQLVYSNSSYVTDTNHFAKEGETKYYSYLGTRYYGMKSFEREFRFSPNVSYEIEGWKNGNNLKNDKQLKEKVTQLYQKLANILATKDKKALSDILYTMYDEDNAVYYNMLPKFPHQFWAQLMETVDYAYNYRIEKDFDIEYSQDGKLIYANPNHQADMLRAIGKQYAQGFTFYMYEDAETNELKFIRL